MNYRFVKITSFYRSFFEYYYSKKKDIINKSYDIQLSDIMNEGFGWADFFKRNMEILGNEAYEIIWNANNIQKKWAEENNLKLSGSDILFHQLKKIKPDVIFFQDSVSFPPEFIKKIRLDIPSVKLIIGWLCSPSNNMHIRTYGEFDFVCACSPEFTRYLTSQGIKNFELNHAFESSVLNKINTSDKKESDLIFAGSFIGSRDFHSKRILFFEQLLKQGVKVRLHTDLQNLSWLKLKAVQTAYFTSGILNKTGLNNIVLNIPSLKKASMLKEMPANPDISANFRNAIKSPVYGYDMFNEISKSKIGLNIHAGVAGEFAANSRMFEITGIGSLLVTDMKKNINDFFKPDEEILVYNSTEECAEMIKWILNNEVELKKISLAGQKRTLKDHTFLNRVEKLNEIIIKHLV